jgi:hypothetical protein
LITTFPLAGDVQLFEFVTKNVYVAPGGKLISVVLVKSPVAKTPSGNLTIVHLPVAKPLNSTLPVGTVHVGCVIAPTTGAVGFPFTLKVTLLLHPSLNLVNVRVTVPVLTPVTSPTLFTRAIAVLLLAHIPPEFGVMLVVLPTQTSVAPPITGGVGTLLIVTLLLSTDEQLFASTTKKL